MPAKKDPATRFRAICLALPSTYEREAWGHPTFRIGKDPGGPGKMFASMADDGSQATMKADPDERPALLADPDRFFLPDYVGSKGWVGVRLAGKGTDWDDVAELVRTSFLFIAPKRIAAELDD
ncbi:MAG: MmcQ/YjbR family DNA-binding protein [Actinomycetota bacterium]|nr:MmcQ/YjbR family DNA-binding protein [Actinomycetota bacterium]